jgi:hypothetical protein
MQLGFWKLEVTEGTGNEGFVTSPMNQTSSDVSSIWISLISN